jgi:hypothetical protein
MDSSTKPDTSIGYPKGYWYQKRIVIEWAQRICSEKELFREDVKGKSKKIENNHNDKKVNVDVGDFSKELPQWPKTSREGWNRT